MTLADLLRMVEATEGPCEGVPECRCCRIQSLVRLAHESGQRSGAAGAKRSPRSSCTWDEWAWTSAHRGDIMDYCMKSGRFADRDSAYEFMQHHFTEAQHWAQSKGERRHDWVAFMKLWLGRELKKMPSTGHSLQGDLFNPKQAERRDTHLRLVEERLRR